MRIRQVLGGVGVAMTPRSGVVSRPPRLTRAGICAGAPDAGLVDVLWHREVHRAGADARR